MVPLSMTLSDLWLRFQGHDIFRHWISQKRHDTATVTIERQYEVVCALSHGDISNVLDGSNQFFKVMAFLKSNISKLWTKGQSFYRTLIGNHTQSIEWYHFQWPWVTSDPDFKVTTFFEVEYRLLRHCTRGKVPNIWNGTTFGDLDWPLIASRGFVSTSWASRWN